MSKDQMDVVGIGNAIVDVLAETTDSFLDSAGLVKGSMSLIDAEQAEALYRGLDAPMECSGGSAANTIVGLASFGANVCYVGKVRDDALGEVFARDIRDAGVSYETEAATAGPGTARCIVLVTPDAQRTMQTFLGASISLAPADISEHAIARAKVVYLEGYLYDPPEAKRAFLQAAEMAHRNGCKVALSLSDAFCVDRHRDEFRDFVKNHVDLLFANEDEIVSLYQVPKFESAVLEVRADCRMAALTRGARGSVIVHGQDLHVIEAEKVEKVVDTTGAGDLFAAGFLFGYTRGQDPQICGKLGSLASAEIISHYGARPKASLADLARRFHA